MRSRLAPADIGQRMAGGLRQRQPVRAEQMAGLAAHSQANLIVDADVAVSVIITPLSRRT